MADIVNQEVVRFSNESVRTICESIRKLYYTLDDMKRKWDASIAPAIAGNEFTDPVVDGRAAQGVSQLTKNDVTLVAVQVNALLGVLNSPGVLNVIQKPCVRPVEVV